MEYVMMALLVVIDQWSKIWIQNTPSMHGHVEVIPNFLYITYVKNTGAAWSILEGKQMFLVIISVLEIILLVYFMLKFKKKNETIAKWSIVLMIAGAIGNLIDRMMLGYVRDFVSTYPFGYAFPVFNIADVCLTVGVILLAIYILIEDSKDEKKEKLNG